METAKKKNKKSTRIQRQHPEKSSSQTFRTTVLPEMNHGTSIHISALSKRSWFALRSALHRSNVPALHRPFQNVKSRKCPKMHLIPKQWWDRLGSGHNYGPRRQAVGDINWALGIQRRAGHNWPWRTRYGSDTMLSSCPAIAWWQPVHFTYFHLFSYQMLQFSGNFGFPLNKGESEAGTGLVTDFISS